MSYRIAAMIVSSILLGGCCRTPASVAGPATPDSLVEPQPTDPQCGACRRVYVTSTQELWVMVEAGMKMPTLDLSLFDGTGALVSSFHGLEPTRMIEEGKAVYAVAGGPAAGVSQGKISWRESRETIVSERVDVEASWAGWPTDAGDYFIGSDKRASADSSEREPSGAGASQAKAKAMDVMVTGKPLGKARLRLAPRTSLPKRTSRPVQVHPAKAPPPKARPTKVRPKAPGHVDGKKSPTVVRKRRPAS